MIQSTKVQCFFPKVQPIYVPITSTEFMRVSKNIILGFKPFLYEKSAVLEGNSKKTYQLIQFNGLINERSFSKIPVYNEKKYIISDDERERLTILDGKWIKCKNVPNFTPLG